LDRADADAIAKAGVDSEEVVIRAFNAKGLKDARKAIEADGFEILESKVNEAKDKGPKWAIKEITKELGKNPDADDVSYWCYANYADITGEEQDVRDEEMDFPEDIYEIIEFFNLDEDSFTEAWGS
jgi:hypothetical protein